MTALRILNLVVWAIMLAYMLPGAWASAGKGARYGDPMRLACALTAIVFLGFNGYWLFGPNKAPDDPFMLALLVLSAALGLFILRLGRTYGRGTLLSDRANHDAG